MNITTLNTIGMDGVIIKKTDTPSGGNGGGVEGEGVGMIYVHKKDILRIFELPEEIDVPQEEFQEMINQLTTLLGIRAMKQASGAIYGIELDVSNAIYEGWLTFENWTAAALYLDTPAWFRGKWEKTWVHFGATNLEEAKTIIAQMFPNQLTEKEFIGN